MSVDLLYASEGGTAADLSNRISFLASRRCLQMRAEGIDSALSNSAEKDPIESLQSRSSAMQGLVVFVISTTGDGEVPKNMAKTWRCLLRKSLSPSTLNGLRFSIFGLGDRTYGNKFCAAARKLDARLRLILIYYLLTLSPRCYAFFTVY